MQVSQFEIYRLIQRAMEALGAGYGVDRDAARHVTWLQARGFPALELFDHELAALEARLPRARLQGPSGHETIVDIDGSPIACAGALVDLVLARFRQSGEGRLRLRGCTTPLFLIPALAETASPGGSLSWLMGEGEVSVTAGGGEAALFAAPEISILPALAAPPGDVLLAMPALATPPGRVQALAARQLADRLNACLSRGVDVDEALWRRIDAVAARVQVPASSVSRERGAGGGDANI